MKSLAKLGLLAAVVGVGATIYAAPGFPGIRDGSDPQNQARQMRMEAMKSQGMDDIRHVSHLRELARKSKDVIRLNCVNDKLVQMHPLLNVMDHLQVELQINPGNMREVLTTSQEIHNLRNDADGCGGEGLLSGEESSNGFTGPTVVDSPYGEPWGGSLIEPPGYASPFN